MYCCPNCFTDDFLGKEIQDKSAQRGVCSFCESKDVPLLRPDALSDIFQSITSLYTTCSEREGVSFSIQVQSDWEIFGIQDEGRRNDLLSKILVSDVLLNKKCKPKVLQDAERVDQWNAFREELKHTNRFFPKNVPQAAELRNWFQWITLPTDLVPDSLYRARINATANSLNCDDMGKPDKKIASNGRANPVGIPYLYVASDVKTAIAEVRPHKGDIVAVSRLSVNKDLKLADLKHPKRTISPFEFEEDNLIQLYRVMPLLVHLGDELAKPVLPRDAELEYLPSQYLCELIKDIGFHGVIYKSSLECGDNYAIFDDESIECVDVLHYRVTDVSITTIQS